MKLYLDDIRDAPAGYIRCYWPDEVITHLLTGKVTHISLDHDLGEEKSQTGYDVILWLEEMVITKNFIPPEITIHSANPVGRKRMQEGIDSIKRHLNKQ